MKRIPIFVRALSLLCFTMCLSGCWICDLVPSWCGLGGNNTGSIAVQTFATVNGLLIVDPNVQIVAFTTQQGSTAPCNGYGSTQAQFNVSGYTDINGVLSASGVCIQQDWIVTRAPSVNCHHLYTYDPIYYPAAVTPVPLYCGLGGRAVGGTTAFDNNNPAPVTAISGAGDFYSTYGTPVSFFYDQYGNPIGEAPVVSISPDGSQATVPTTYLQGQYDGSYGVMIANVQADGTLLPSVGFTVEVTGLGTIDPYNGDPPQCWGFEGMGVPGCP